MCLLGQSQLPTTPVPLTNTPLQTKVTPVQSSTAAVRSSTTPDQSSTTPVQSYTGQGQSASGQGHGATYIRWGMTSCPSLSTSVYTGNQIVMYRSQCHCNPASIRSRTCLLTEPSVRFDATSFDNIYNGSIFPSLNPAKIFRFNSR